MTKSDQSRNRAGDEMVRLTVAEAALKLGISEAGVRKRVQRNQIPHERDDDGSLRVWVSPGEARHAESRDAPEESRGAPPQPESRALISEMRGRIASLEHQLEQERQANSEHRRLLAAALEQEEASLRAANERIKKMAEDLRKAEQVRDGLEELDRLMGSYPEGHKMHTRLVELHIARALEGVEEDIRVLMDAIQHPRGT